MKLRHWVISIILFGFGGFASAQSDAVFTAHKAADDLRAATVALTKADGEKDRVAALSQAVKAYEDGLRAMRESLRNASIQEKTIRLTFDSKRDQLSRLLGVLQSLERAPTPLLLIHPSGPLGTAQSGQILSEVTPAIHRQAEELRQQLDELKLIQALQTTAAEDLKVGLEAVQAARLALSDAIGNRDGLPQRFLSDPEALETLVENSETLTGFANGLADLPFDGQPETPPDFIAAKGTLPLPVYGTMLRSYDEADAAGLRRPGIVLTASALSLVSAPWSATIRYSGPFLDYGNVMILEPAPGYLVVIAGLGQVYGAVGDILSPGDPVGLLGGTDPAAEEFLVEASQGSGAILQETLYIEIRENGNAVDPVEWFVAIDR